MKTLAELRQERGALVEQMRKILDTATDEKRAMTAEEAARFDQCDLEQGRLGERIAREDPTARGGRLYAGRDGLADLVHELESRTTDSGLRPMPMDRGGAARAVGPGEVRILTRDERVRDHVDADLPEGVRPHDLSLGRAVRAIVTGDWRGAEAERRTMGVAGGASGQFLVPQILSAQVIDLARNQARVMQAGAQTVVMDAPEVSLARVSKDPVAAWKGENQAGGVSDVELERIVLRSRTLFAAVKMSVELFEDGRNVGMVVENALASALALELDRAALRGGQTVGPIEPTGVRWVSGVQTIAVNGAIVGFDKFSEAYEKIQTANGPTDGVSVILSPREWGKIDRTKDGDGNPLTPPESWIRMQKFPTTQIPTNLGGGANESEAYVAPWSELLVGMRTELTIEASRVAADSGDSAFRNLQVWVRAYLRGDVTPAREKFFVVLTGITP